MPPAHLRCRIITLCAPLVRSAALASASMSGREHERGAASVEQAALAALIALLLIAAISALAADGEVDAGRGLAGGLARRPTRAPRLPGARRHHPLVPACGWPLARLTRALAPAPRALPGASGLGLM